MRSLLSRHIERFLYPLAPAALGLAASGPYCSTQGRDSLQQEAPTLFASELAIQSLSWNLAVLVQGRHRGRDFHLRFTWRGSQRGAGTHKPSRLRRPADRSFTPLPPTLLRRESSDPAAHVCLVLLAPSTARLGVRSIEPRSQAASRAAGYPASWQLPRGSISAARPNRPKRLSACRP